MGRCLSKLVGVSHGLLGELFVLNRFIYCVCGGWISESVRWRQCVSVVLVICVFSCYDLSSVKWLVSSYMLVRGTGLKNSYLGCQIAESGLRY